MARPSWLALFAPLPEDAGLTRAPVGAGDAIAGWETLSIYLSAAEAGLRSGEGPRRPLGSDLAATGQGGREGRGE